jgi:tetratricopeptide (TPR) repeat protein
MQLAKEWLPPNMLWACQDGYVIFLSNDATYWSEPASDVTIGSAFRLHEGRVAGGAHAALGAAALHFDWEWPAAEQHLARALELNPGWSLSVQWNALRLAVLGRTEEAFTWERRALSLDPLGSDMKRRRSKLTIDHNRRRGRDIRYSIPMA